MISFIPLEISTKYYILISIYFTIVAAFFWRDNIVKYDAPYKKQTLLITLVFIHLLFAFESGDYYHYYEYCIYHEFEFSTEPFYQFLASAIDYNYLLFRIIVWGGALCLFMLSAKRFGLDQDKTVYVMYIMFITIFDYARASLAMTAYFYGLSFICMPIKKNTLLSYIIAVLIIIASINLHRSMLFTAAMTIVAFIPLGKKSLFTILIVFAVSAPILSILFESVISSFFMGGGDTEEKVAIIASLNYDDWTEGGSVFEWIRRCVEYATIILPLIYLSFRIFNINEKQIQNRAMLKLFKVSVALVLMAFSILMVKIGNVIVFIRFLYMAFIPVVFLVCYSRQQHIVGEKTFKAFLILCLLCKYFGICKTVIGGGLA